MKGLVPAAIRRSNGGLGGAFSPRCGPAIDQQNTSPVRALASAGRWPGAVLSRQNRLLEIEARCCCRRPQRSSLPAAIRRHLQSSRPTETSTSSGFRWRSTGAPSRRCRAAANSPGFPSGASVSVVAAVDLDRIPGWSNDTVDEVVARVQAIERGLRAFLELEP